MSRTAHLFERAAALCHRVHERTLVAKRATQKQRETREAAAGWYGLESLEGRVLLTTVTWDGGGDGTKWSDRFNWTGDALPGSNDDVVLNIAGAPTITYTAAAGSTTIKSLTSDESLVVSGGTLAITNTANLTQSTTLNGGTIQGGTWSATGGATLVLGGSGTLAGVTIAAGMTVDGTTTTNNTTITGGLTLDGAINMGRDDANTYTRLYFLGTQTLSGTGGVLFGGWNANALYSQDNGSAATLTIASTITVHGKSGGVLGYNSDASVINNGTINADTAGGTITLTGSNPGTFSNTGTMTATNGGTLTLAGPWSNTGTLSENASTLNLGGAFTTAGVGTFTRTGGTVNLTGTLTNTATTLALTATTGSWNLAGGTINGGTISGTGGATLVLAGSGTLAGVTLANGSVIDATAFVNNVTITGGLILNGTLNMGKDDASTYSRLYFLGSQTLGGTGSILFGGWNANSLYSQDNGSAATLTIGSNITVHGKNGGVLGYNSDASVINNGTINADTAGGVITLTGSNPGTFSSTGTMTATNGGTLTLAGPWSNTGTLSENASTLNLGGTFTTAGIGTFTRMGGTVNLTGTLTNATTLALTATTGSWNLAGGTINGGTISGTGGATLVLAGTGILAGVTLANGSVIDATAFVNNTTITGGLILNGTLNMGKDDGSTYSRLYFLGSQTLGGTGSILFGGWNANSLYSQDNGSAATLTIGSNITVHGKNGGVLGYNSDASVINNGTINADTAGGTLTLTGSNPGTFTNNGTMTATNGGTLTLTGPWSNTGTLSENASTLNLGGAFTTAGIGNFNRSAGTVNITGTLTNATTLALTATTGSWNLAGGTISGGTISGTGGATLVLAGTGTLAGVTLANGSVIDATAFVNNTTITGGLILNGTLNMGKDDASTYSRLYFLDSQTLGGTGSILFGGWNANALYSQDNGSAATLTIGSNITVHGKNGGVLGYNSDASVINNGTINADTAGGTITLTGSNPGTFSNTGTMTATNGGTLTLAGPWSNTGTLSENASTLNLGGAFTTAGIGTFNRSAGTVNLTGTLTNTAATLTLNNTTGSWVLNGGTISGGTIAGNAALVLGGSGTLSGVTLASGSVVDATTFVNNTTITNGLTLNGTLNLGNTAGTTYSRLYFAGTQTLGGTGSVVFGGWSANAIYSQDSGGPATLTIGPNIVIHGKNGSVTGYNSDASVTNNGTVSADTASGTIFVGGGASGALTNTGTLSAINGGTLTITGAFSNSGQGVLSSSAASLINVSGNILGDTTSPGLFNPQGKVTLNGSGTSGNPQQLEAMSGDLGAVNAGYTGNFAYGTLALSGNTYVKLVDLSDNAAGSSAEAVYVNSLIVPAGTTLDLNGLHLYARAVQVNGTLTGGTINQFPDSGPLVINSTTPGSISVAGELDEWSFFGRAGEAITVIVNPGTSVSPAPIAPQLGYANVVLLDASDNVLGSGASATSGGLVALDNITLPADGNYKIRVNAATGHASSTGNYLVTAWDVTTDNTTLNLDQLQLGNIETPYAIDKWTFSAVAGQQVRFDLLNASASGLAFSLDGPLGFSGFTDITDDSTLINLPSTGTYTFTAHGTGGASGSYSFRMLQTSQTALTLGTTFNGTIGGSGQAQLFKLNVPTATPLVVHFDDSTAGDHNELYAKFGSAPTRADYDLRYTATGADQNLLIPSANTGDWYFLVYSESAPAASTFTLLANASSVVITGSTPDHSGNSAPAVLTITGAGYDPTTTVQLIGADSTAYAPSDFSIDSYTQITATFNLPVIPAGAYSLRVTKPGNITDTLPNALTVTSAGSSHLDTKIILPSVLGRHAVATLYLQYSNTGTVAMPAPMLILESADANDSDRPLLTLDQSKVTQGFWTSALPDGFSHTISILASGATPGVLQPGESVQVPVYYAGLQQPWDFSDTNIEFRIRTFETSEASVIDWAGLKTSLKPSTLSSETWDAVYPNLQAQVGTTWGDYVRMLDDNAGYLGRLGEKVTDVGRLWGFELAQAAGLSPVGTIAAAVDAAAPSPGLALTFTRSFGGSIDDRYAMGILGRGWKTPWDIRLTTSSDGSVDISGGNTGDRRFQPDSRHAGSYFALPGDTGTLTALGGGAFKITESTGEVTAFLANGKLDYTKDANGNKITAGYDGSGRLITLTHTSGATLTLAYDAAGLVSTITDSLGRVTTYTYDAGNEHLLSAATPSGTTQYTYSTGNGPAREHALLSIAFPGGTHQFYTYDSQGRLATTSRDGGAQQINYTYDTAGTVSITNAVAGTQKIYFDYRGLVVKAQDALGNATYWSFNNALQLTRTTDATGQTWSYNYDGAGNLLSALDPLGHSTQYAYSATGNRITALTDPDGNVTGYSYDAAGNLLLTTYANGTSESVTYDPLGKALSYTNRRGQAVSYAYNAIGQVTRETFADTTHNDYTYDTHGNLLTFTDATGTTTFVYDAAEQMTSVTYPDARSLTFTYDAGGRRTRMVDQSGFTVNYAYNAAGLLSGLTDGASAAIVTYTYDAAGRLSRKDEGNGAYTTYAYDAAGRVLHLINRAPDNAINSRFDYSYDALGRRTTMATLDGTWTYTYDGAGQLVHAVFASTNVSIASQDLAYSYDAAGNRVQTVLNGVTTAYTTNNLNQYTAAGGTTFAYDADGNLTSQTTGGVTTTYTYDVKGRLTGVSSPGETWTYTYDALGLRVGATHNGQATTYLQDPQGLGSVVASYDNTNALVAHYVYGQGLVSQVSNTGVSSYYDFDAQGSTAGITNGAGDYVNSYAYTPYGQTLASTEAIANPFQFIGQAGVMDDGGGLDAMRARSYSADFGRFTSPDPTGFLGGDANLYSYAWNAPTTYADPAGQSPTLHLSLLASIVAKLRAVGSQYTHPVGSFGKGISWAKIAAVSKGSSHTGGKNTGSTTPSGSMPGLAVVVVTPGPGGGSYPGTGGGGPSNGSGGGPGSAPSDPEDPVYPPDWDGPIYPDDPDFPGDPGPGGPGDPGGPGSPGDPGGPGGPGDPGPGGPGDPGDPGGPGGPGGGGDEPPGPGGGGGGGSGGAGGAGSQDPNDLIGPGGFGSAGFITGDQLFPYRIDFENDAAATAPAQFVGISNQLDANLDWSTFELADIGFGDTLITVPAHLQHYQTTVSMTYNGHTFDVLVEAGIHSDTGEVYATFQAIDPDTSLPPDVLTGFLPPEDGTGRGMGHVSYTIRPDANLPTGTAIKNIAIITFDVNPSIATNQSDPHDPSQGTDSAKEALVTIDAGGPTSSVTALPATNTGTTINVAWSGQDDANGSGIATYDIFVSDNSGTYTLWLDDTADTSDQYTGVVGHTYAFYSVATDNVGFVEDAPSSADTQTTVAADDTPTVTFTAASKTVTVAGTNLKLTLKGNGTGKAWAGDDGSIERIELTGTDAKSNLTIAVVDKNGVARVDQITVGDPDDVNDHTDLGTLAGKGISLGDSLTITGGIKSLTLANVADQHVIDIGSSVAIASATVTFDTLTDVTFTSETPIAKFTASAWNDSDDNDTLTAPWIGTLTIKGAMQADVVVTSADAKGVAIGTYSAGTVGHFDGSDETDITVQSAGGVKTIKTNAWYHGTITAPWIGTLTIKGAMQADVVVTGADAKGLGIGTYSAGAVGTDNDGVDLTLQGAGGAKTVKTASWLGGTITAPWINSLTVGGNMNADVVVTSTDAKGVGVGVGTYSAGIVGDDTDLTLQAGGGVKTIKVADWLGGTITAGYVGSITSSGNFGASFDLSDAAQKSTLAKLTVKGAVTNITLKSAGNIGAVIVGSSTGSKFLAGVADIPDSADDFTGDFAIASFTSKGAFSASSLAASRLLKVSLASVDTDNAGDPFGLYATVTPKSYKRLDTPGVKLVPPLATPADIEPGLGDDFVIFVL